jgi:hypothetical protein
LAINPPEHLPPILEERVPTPAPTLNVEREVFIASKLKKSQERLNRAFAKYLHAKPIEQALASALGTIPSADQDVPSNMEDDTVATPEDNPIFDETVCHPTLLRLFLFYV